MIEAMRLLVEAVEADLDLFNIPTTARIVEAISTCRTAIEAAEKQEPVAWRIKSESREYFIFQKYPKDLADFGAVVEPLYATPAAAQTELKILTDAQIDDLWDLHGYFEYYSFARAIEAKLKGESK